MKKKIYCVFCGAKNDNKNEICKNCHESLTPKDHLWKDYLKNHIKEDVKDGVENKLSSIITNYITSHLYGIAFSILFIVTTITGVTAITKDEYHYIKEIEESPVSVVELSLDNETVKKAHEFLSSNQDRKLETGFYEGKKMTYSDLKETKALAYQYAKVEGKEITFSSCEEAKNYPDIYSLCQRDSSYVVGEYARYYYLFNAKDFEENYKKLYGNKNTLIKENFNIRMLLQCTYYQDSDQYICHNFETGWWADEAEFTKLIKAEKVNNQMILYDYYVWGTPNGSYKDFKKTIKISDKEIWNNEKLVEQGQLYKHIFKNNGNGEYYWYSSEPVNSLED